MAFLEQPLAQPLEVCAPVDKPAGTPRLEPESEVPELVPDTNWSPFSTDIVIFDSKGLKWQEDLSANGQWLFELLSCYQEGDLKFLEQYAQEQGKDLQGAIAEIESYGLELDRSTPGWIDLPYIRKPAKGS